MFLESPQSRQLPKRIAASILLVAFGSEVCFASPAGQTVVSGNASFNSSGAITTIRASDGAIINYSSFNIGKGETVQFVQPDAASRVLNRVTSGNPTQIFGSLLANGNVYLVNSAGLYFGNGSVVNVGGLFAAAGHMSDADFLSKTNRFNLTSSVVNEGLIQANGHVALLGNSVSNSGAVSSTTGMVTMVSGDDVLVGERGSNIFVNSGPTAKTPAKTGVTNTGKVEGQRVLLGAGDYLGVTVNTSGLVKAKDVTVHSGAKGKTVVSGKVDASTNVAGQAGGNVQVLGDKVSLLGADISANGQLKGGQIRIGGDFQGKGDLQRASETVVDAATTLSANGLGPVSDGGSVVIWSDKVTTFKGLISARGGAKGGLGGSAEVSSKGLLKFEGNVDLWSATGKNGTLLLDPTSIEVGLTADLDGNGADVIGDISEASYTGFASKITASGLSTLLETTNVRLEATTSISVTSNISPSTGSYSLTLKAPAITLGANVTTRGAQTYDGAVTQSANVVLTANNFTYSSWDAVNNNLTLTITQPITLPGLGFSHLKDFTSDGIGGTAFTGNFTTAGAQTYGNAVTLQADVTLSSTGGGNISLNSTVDSDATQARSLTVLTTGAATFGGNVGATRALNILETGYTGTTVFSKGSSQVVNADTQNYKNAVGFNNTVSMNGSAITFESTVDSANSNFQDLNVTVTGANGAKFKDLVGNTKALGDLIVAGKTTFFADVKTDGIQSYSDNVTQRSAITVTGADLQLAVGKTWDGYNKDLVLDISNRISVSDANFLKVSNFTSKGTLNLAGDFATLNGQTYENSVSLTGNVKLNVSNGGLVTFKKDLTGAGFSLTLDTNTNGLFNDAIGLNGASMGALLLKGNATFKKDIYATSLQVDGTTALGANVTSTGNQTYQDAVTLGGDVILNSGAANITFTKTIDSDAANTLRSLTAASSGNIYFQGNIGSGIKLAQLQTNSVTAAGLTQFNKGSAQTVTATQQSYQQPVQLNNDVSLDGTKVTFTSTVNSPAAKALTFINTTEAELDAAVGATSALSALTVGGKATLKDDVSATTQTYTGAVTLGKNNVQLTGTNVTFSGAVDGAGKALSLGGNTVGVFNGVVGGGGAIGALTIGGNATFAAAINAASVSVNGTTALNANVTTSGLISGATGVEQRYT
ncbi:MAG: filamentous hemagglutinin N-terminal domain-containing protein, partial [Verrucomicrobiota bacterium]